MAKWVKTSMYRGDDTSGFIENIYTCSDCGQKALLDDEWFITALTDYCPHCGAKMEDTE